MRLEHLLSRDFLSVRIGNLYDFWRQIETTVERSMEFLLGLAVNFI